MQNNARIRISNDYIFMIHTDNESKCQLVSSRGILKSCNIHSIKPISSNYNFDNYNFEYLNDSTNIIYICNTAINNFINIVLPQIKNKFILVSGDSDTTIILDIPQALELINHPNLIHWFSQNLTYVHPKLTQIPIGLDYHTISENNNHEWGDKITPQEQENILIQIKEY
jgi:hypothetical protein